MERIERQFTYDQVQTFTGREVLNDKEILGHVTLALNTFSGGEKEYTGIGVYFQPFRTDVMVPLSLSATPLRVRPKGNPERPIDSELIDNEINTFLMIEKKSQEKKPPIHIAPHFLGMGNNPFEYYIESVPGDNLHRFLYTVNKLPISESDRMKAETLLLDRAHRDIALLHQMGVSHNDIKLENFLVSEKNLKVLVTDFRSASNRSGIIRDDDAFNSMVYKLTPQNLKAFLGDQTGTIYPAQRAQEILASSFQTEEEKRLFIEKIAQGYRTQKIKISLTRSLKDYGESHSYSDNDIQSIIKTLDESNKLTSIYADLDTLDMQLIKV